MKMNKNSKKHQAGARGKSGGLSLIEAMIVLFILAISVAVAIPLMVGTFGRANSEVYLDRVKATLELGRITAMSEFVSVFLCPSTDGATCNTGVPANNWGANRLILFTSQDGVDSDVDRIITTIEAPQAGEYISSTNGNSIEFRPNGLSATALTLRYCSIVDDQGANRSTRTIKINIIGRITLDILNASESC